MAAPPDLSPLGFSILFDVQGNDGRRYIEYRMPLNGTPSIPSNPTLPPGSGFEVFATVAPVTGGGFALTLRDVPAPPPPARVPFGVNLEQMIPFGRSQPFSDVVKTARAFYQPGHAGNEGFRAAVDANGWPAGDFDVMLIEGAAASMMGNTPYTVVLEAAGPVSIQASPGATVGPLATVNGVTRASLTYHGVQNALFLTVTGTTGAGPRRIKVLRPGVSEAAEAAQPFSPTFLAMLAALKPGTVVLRSMDALETNNTKVVKWADRSTPATAIYGSTARALAPGMPYEHLITLCNTAGADLWLNVPVTADDDYRHQLATLVAATLHPDLILYTEFGNEVWNNGLGSFAPNQAAATAGQAANGFDPGLAGPQRVANESVKLGQIFAAALGAGRTVRPVLGGQGVDFHTFDPGLAYLKRRGITPSTALWGLAVAPYAPLTPALSLTDPNTLLLKGGHVTAHQATATTNGLKLCCYESGVDFNGPGGNTALSQQKDPRMQALMQAYWDAWIGQGPIIHYKAASEPGVPHGLTDDAADLTQPKFKAAVAHLAKVAANAH